VTHPTSDHTALLTELASRREKVYDYLFRHEYIANVRPAHIHDASLSYLKLGGKSLRPAVLLLSCAAVGGDEQIALPAAAGIEVYHTWTLVHDDIIDRDVRRRNAPTVHIEFRDRGQNELKFERAEAEHYGTSIGILAGDVQQSWSYMLFYDLYRQHGVDARLVLELIAELATRVQLILVEGETLDIQFAKRGLRELAELDEATVIDMLWRKTGVLYEFAGKAGATIGLGRSDHPLVGEIAAFCSKAGIAFQLQDDLLGVIGDEAKTGKAVGADIREGKKTVIVLRALQNGTDAQRRELMSILGRGDSTQSDIARATDLLRELDGIGYTQQLADRYMSEALTHLAAVPDSPYKTLLQQWAMYVVGRQK
jgi:geranylgeranyl diphosphate synthase type I